MTMRSLCLKLKVVVVAGIPVDEVLNDMVEMAGRVGCTVECTFNDVTVWAIIGDDPKILKENFLIANRSDDTYKFVTGIPQRV
jgi:hypothetical protein